MGPHDEVAEDGGVLRDWRKTWHAQLVAWIKDRQIGAGVGDGGGQASCAGGDDGGDGHGRGRIGAAWTAMEGR